MCTVDWLAPRSLLSLLGQGRDDTADLQSCNLAVLTFSPLRPGGIRRRPLRLPQHLPHRLRPLRPPCLPGHALTWLVPIYIFFPRPFIPGLSQTPGARWRDDATRTQTRTSVSGNGKLCRVALINTHRDQNSRIAKLSFYGPCRPRFPAAIVVTERG